MSSRATASWVEKLERFLDMKPPAILPTQHWLYRITSALFAAVTLLAFLSAIFAETPALVLFWFAHTLLNTTLFGLLFGQGLYEGSFGRFGNDVHQTGRKLRSLSIVVFAIFLPFYCAIAAGSFAGMGGNKYVAVAFVGFVVGVALMLISALFAVHRYRKNRRRSP